MRDPLRHHVHREKPLMGDSFMERMSEKVASGMGTVAFVVVGSIVILAWVFMNGAAGYISHTVKALAHGGQFDPEPWILLNLIFSGVAFYTGALVIIAQKAQAKRDRASEEADAKHREELAQTNLNLLKQNTELTERIDKLTAELHAHIVGEDGALHNKLDDLVGRVEELHDKVDQPKGQT